MTRDPPKSDPSQGASAWPYGGGITGALVRDLDWSKTPLGPAEAWPDNLRTTVTNLLHSRHAALVFWGPELIQVYNDGYLPLLGAKHPEAEGQRAAECWAEAWPLIAEQIDDVMRRAKASWNEDQLVPILRNGRIEEVYFTYCYSPVFNARGGVDGTLVTTMDTTKSVLVERRLRKLQALTEHLVFANDAATVLEHAASMLRSADKDVPFAVMSLVDAETGDVRAHESVGLGSSPAPAALLALAKEAMVKGRAVHITDGDDGKGLRIQAGPWPEAVAEVFISPIRVSGEHRASGFIAYGISPRITFDEAYREHLVQMTAQIENALSLQQSRSQARMAQQDLRDFFLQAPAPMCILSGPKHIFTLANEPYLDLVGAEVLGKTVLEAFTEAIGGPFIKILDEVYRTGVPFIGKELPFTRVGRDGATDLMINIGYHPFRDRDGVITGILAFVQDVTEQVAAKQALQTAVAARDAFLAIASHELRTPLTSMTLQLQLHLRKLRRKPAADFTPEAIEKLLSTTSRQTDRLTRLVDDMLDISRIAAGKLSMAPEHASLSALVRETAERLSPELAAAGSELVIELDDSIEGAWDRYRLEQVLTNLLTNVVRYAPGAPVRVSLARQGERVVLAVRDQGPGIAPANLETVFERFARLPSLNERGLGLGLYICRQIIEAHGGTIRAESQLGQGTTFVVELPAGAP